MTSSCILLFSDPSCHLFSPISPTSLFKPFHPQYSAPLFPYYLCSTTPAPLGDTIPYGFFLVSSLLKLPQVKHNKLEVWGWGPHSGEPEVLAFLDLGSLTLGGCFSLHPLTYIVPNFVSLYRGIKFCCVHVTCICSPPISWWLPGWSTPSSCDQGSHEYG